MIYRPRTRPHFLPVPLAAKVSGTQRVRKLKDMRKSILLGTKNPDKLKELRILLKGSGIRVLSLSDFPECPEARERGKTFEANARIKARIYSKHAGMLAIADDSGLSVSALGGRPGVYSARFAGPGCTYQDNNRKVLNLLKARPRASRSAKFVSAMALYYKGRPVTVVKGECRGKITPEARGRNGFGYDPVFIPSGQPKTFAEFAPSVKNKISHRGKALRLALPHILNFWRNKI